MSLVRNEGMGAAGEGGRFSKGEEWGKQQGEDRGAARKVAGGQTEEVTRLASGV